MEERLGVKMYPKLRNLLFRHLPKGSSERYNPVLVEGSVVTDEEISTLNLNRLSSHSASLVRDYKNGEKNVEILSFF
jgi:hypothetical protein